MAKNKLKIVLGATVGNFLEWYDFILYALFAPIIAKNFFPKEHHHVALFATFGIFAVGYFMRPLGAIFIGHIGDKYSRKIALVTAIAFMGIATALIGLLPTYASVGFYAAFLLMLLRMIQGIAVGGEFPGSMVILTEMAPTNHRAFMGSLGLSGATLGVLLGVAVVNIFSLTLSPSALVAWGWRIPFILGLLLALIGLYLRFKVFAELQISNVEIIDIPFVELIKKHKKTILKSVLILAPTAVYSGILSLFIVAYVTHYQHFELTQAFRLSLIVTILLLVFFPIGAALADKVKNYNNWLTIGNLVVAITTYPLYFLMHYSTVACFWAFIVMTIIFSLALGPIAAFLVVLFPANIRYSGFAIVHGLAFSLIAGTSPLVLNWLAYKITVSAPGFYGILSAIIAVIALRFTKDFKEI